MRRHAKRTNRAFTLVELIVSMAVSTLLMGVLITVLLVAYRAYAGAQTLNSVHGRAVVFSQKVKGEVQNAGYVTLLSAVPASSALDSGYSYLYAKDGKLHLIKPQSDGTLADSTFMTDGGYAVAVAFKKSTAVTLQASVSVTPQGSSQSTTLTTDILLDNLGLSGGSSIEDATGGAGGGCVQYKNLP